MQAVENNMLKETVFRTQPIWIIENTIVILSNTQQLSRVFTFKM
jgi:hypothetical protein